MLLLIPQRYEFSSKSQLTLSVLTITLGCCWYHKGTNFQANHNGMLCARVKLRVVVDTTKVRIFKQITTVQEESAKRVQLLLIPQRYEFSSKSQPKLSDLHWSKRCCWYHKGTNFQANHNRVSLMKYILLLLLIPQRYEFSSKSQPLEHCELI